MLTGDEIIILTKSDARKLLAACGYIVDDSSHAIFSDMEDRFLDNVQRLSCDAHDAALAVIELRDILRRMERIDYDD